MTSTKNIALSQSKLELCLYNNVQIDICFTTRNSRYYIDLYELNLIFIICSVLHPRVLKLDILQGLAFSSVWASQMVLFVTTVDVAYLTTAVKTTKPYLEIIIRTPEVTNLWYERLRWYVDQISMACKNKSLFNSYKKEKWIKLFIIIVQVNTCEYQTKKKNWDLKRHFTLSTQKNSNFSYYFITLLKHNGFYKFVKLKSVSLSLVLRYYTIHNL